jgi:hypothetical protein
LPAGAACQFHFEVTNPEVGQGAPEVSVEAISPAGLMMSRLDPPPDGARPLAVAGFALARIEQSTASASARNRISVRLAVHATLSRAERSALTISGLVGCRAPPDSTLRIFSEGGGRPGGADARVFEQYGAFSPEDGSLTLTLASDLEPHVEYSFYFVVVNAAASQGSPDIAIRSSRPDSPPHLMDKGAGNAAPLLVAGFLRKGIAFGGAMDSVDGGRHAVVVALQTRASLLAGSSVIISGLPGGRQAAAEGGRAALSPHSEAARRSFAPEGRWSGPAGDLVLSVARDTDANATYRLSFRACGGDGGGAAEAPPAPRITISASGVDIPAVAMDAEEDVAA